MSRATSPSKLQFWKERFDQFNDSQQTVQQFCKSAGCSEHTFYYWKRKLTLRTSSTPSESESPKSADDLPEASSIHITDSLNSVRFLGFPVERSLSIRPNPCQQSQRLR